MTGIVCAACGRGNREIALYCRFCGKEIEKTETPGQPSPALTEPAASGASAQPGPASPGTPAPDIPSDYVGHKDIRTELDRVKKSLRFQRERRRAGAGGTVGSKIFVFRGGTGTGKTLVASCFVKELRREKCLESDRPPKITTARELSRQYADEFALAQYLRESKPAALVVDDATDNTDFIHELILALTKLNEECLCILAGSREGFETFFEKNAEDKQRIAGFFDFQKLSIEELALILMKQLREKNYRFDPALRSHFEAYIKERLADTSCEYKNGWLVEKDIIPTIEKNQEARLTSLDSASLSSDDYGTIIRDDLPLKTKPRTLDEILAELDAMIGLADLKKKIRDIAYAIAAQKKREEAGLKGTKQAVHFVFMGNPGTGKTTVARKLGALFKAIELLPTDKVVEVDRSKLVAEYTGQTAPLVNKACDDAMGGILFIDEAYTLSGGKEGGADSFGQEAIDALLKRMEDDRGKFVVIAAGYEEEMKRFLAANSGLMSRFTPPLHLADYTPEELFAIFTQMVQDNDYELSPEAQDTARRAVKDIYDKRGKNFANGREVRNLFDETIRTMGTRLAAVKDANEKTYNTILGEDIPYEKPKERTVEEILTDLNKMTGLAVVKEEVKKLADDIKMQKEREAEGLATAKQGLHIIFTGNPGTGKTTVARMLGELFKAMGLLPKGEVVEVDKSKMVASYVGETPKLVNSVCDSAYGGILFIDEAYTLAGEEGMKDPFGQEAIDTLMKRMEDDAGKYVVIAAGYKKEMERFVKANPGLSSRFTHKIHLEDYLPEELFEIYSGFLSKKQYVLTPEAAEKAKEALLEIYENRDDSFANGRTARNLADETVRRQSGRISALEKHLRDREIFMTITAEDIPLAPRAKELSVDEILSDLDSMIGLTELKAEVRVLADSIRMDRERVAGGGAQAEAQSYHIVFTGNPGTGKTTVARKLGALFKAMGLLPSGKVIEVDRSKLVAGYVGQTAPQTNKIIDEAMGGILFIDEAYTLAQGGQDAFGQEAIDTLLKRMEDDKGRFVVIAAGYRREMERFISSNSGLESRFTKFFNLVDYTAAELQSIYEHTAAKNGYTIAGDARPVLAKAVQAIYAGRGETFANGREMRKLFEETRRRQAARLARLDKTERTAQALGTITAGDIPVQEGGEA